MYVVLIRMLMTPVKGVGLQRRDGRRETVSLQPFVPAASGLALPSRHRRLGLHFLRRWDILWLERFVPVFSVCDFNVLESDLLMQLSLPMIAIA
jgi:hypothetical protein